MTSDVIHGIRKRSWWDGSVETWCGETHTPRLRDECWLKGQVNCAGCIRNWKAAN